jgi:hypothetical protein
MRLTVCLHCSTPTSDHDGRCQSCGHYAAQSGSDCQCPDCVPECGNARPAYALAEPGAWDWRSRGPTCRVAGVGKRGSFAMR